ncbi:protoporphyrinogen oxidase [Williamsia deligens]|uniref:Coproporphyrinogen III oxidase n=1 Tax=Williamsia deligens TaxID=321325 RepID=A0ABW3GGB2_9NOCA|nr:protoporphyrinogen oxidase [Williamsia deligens]MCP2195381.1 oxygen-dependent protoporphyrinogen oxidase [Williamsia deligens]
MTAHGGPGATHRVAVVGAGVSGLVTALAVRDALGADCRIDVFEGSSRPGGLLTSRTVAGLDVDAGAESFIVRRPEAVALIDRLGLSGHVVTPTGRRPAVLARGRLQPLPRPTVMGIPAAAAAVSDVADADALERMATEPDRPFEWTPGGDVAIGALVGDRFGRSVVDRSVDPMLSGVYSARADDIGLRAALPQIAARLDAGATSLTEAVGAVLPPTSGAPVFGALDTGYRTLVDALVDAAGVEPTYDDPVAAVTADGDRWTVEHGNGSVTVHDAVVLAVPAPAAARLLASAAPVAATALREVEVAGSALVVMALAESVRLPDNSGVLVATGEATTAKAITLSSQKWPHLSGGPQLVRVSFGRLGDPVDDMSDDDLTAAAVADLGLVSDLGGGVAPGRGDVLDAVVQRWPVGLPRYAPGHGDLVARVDAALPRGLATSGASYGGVGVPACIARARVATDRIVADLTLTGGSSDGTMER